MDKQFDLEKFGISEKLTQDNPRFLKAVSVNLRVLTLLSDFSAADVAVKMKMSLPSLSRYLKRLQVFGFVEKKGYAVWEVKSFSEAALRSALEKEVNTKYPLRSVRDRGDTKVKVVRTHAIQAVVRVPSVLRSSKRWSSQGRKLFLAENDIVFKPIQQGEQLFVDDCRVWFTSKSLVVWMPRSWFVPDADTGYSYAVYELQQLLRKIEKNFRISLRIKGKLIFRIARQHHALIKNGLAKQYNKENRKLFVFNQRGLWLVIDDSFNLDELEGVANFGPNGKESRDAITKVQDFFNGVEKTGITAEGILEMIHANQSQLQYYAENVVSHVKAVQGIEAALSKLNEVLEGKK